MSEDRFPIHAQMALVSVDLLATITAARTSSLGRLRRLAVDDGGARAGGSLRPGDGLSPTRPGESAPTSHPGAGRERSGRSLCEAAIPGGGVTRRGLQGRRRRWHRAWCRGRTGGADLAWARAAGLVRLGSCGWSGGISAQSASLRVVTERCVSTGVFLALCPSPQALPVHQPVCRHVPQNTPCRGASAWLYSVVLGGTNARLGSMPGGDRSYAQNATACPPLVGRPGAV
jgi:hypothetical protein